jgi:hypothetical protein
MTPFDANCERVEAAERAAPPSMGGQRCVARHRWFPRSGPGARHAARAFGEPSGQRLTSGASLRKAGARTRLPIRRPRWNLSPCCCSFGGGNACGAPQRSACALGLRELVLGPARRTSPFEKEASVGRLRARQPPPELRADERVVRLGLGRLRAEVHAGFGHARRVSHGRVTGKTPDMVTFLHGSDVIPICTYALSAILAPKARHAPLSRARTGGTRGP